MYSTGGRNDQLAQNLLLAGLFVFLVFYIGAVLFFAMIGIWCVWSLSHLFVLKVVGIVFSGMFALGIVLFSGIPRYTGDLLGVLLGNILGITEQPKPGQRGLLPPNVADSRNTIVEIRAGAGGSESALFAADLYRMYCRYAEARGWKVETMDSNFSHIIRVIKDKKWRKIQM